MYAPWFARDERPATQAAFYTQQHLEYQALGLLAALFLELLDVDVLPDEDGENAKRHEARASDNHQALRVGVGANNSIPLRCTIKVQHLHSNVAKDERSIDLGLFWEKLQKLAGGDVVPDSSSDCETD